MKIITAGVTSAMLAVGIAGSVAAYRTQAATADVIRPVSQETAEDVAPTTAATGRSHVRWAPCPAGSSLEKGACVTDVIHTVVLTAPSPTVQPSTTPEMAETAQPSDDDSDGSDDSDHSDSSKGSDDQAEADDHSDDKDEADDHGDDHGDDHSDDDSDDHGDDHGDDDSDDSDDHEVED